MTLIFEFEASAWMVASLLLGALPYIQAFFQTEKGVAMAISLC